MDADMPTRQTFKGGTVSQTIIAPHQLYDPLLVLLKGKLRLNEWWIIAASGVVAAVGLYSCLRLGLLTPLRVLSGSLMVLLWTGLYLFLPSSMARLFNGLWDNGVIGESQAHRREPLSYQSFVDKQARLIGSRWWVGVALFLLGLYWLYRLFFAHDMLTHTPWWVQLQVIFLYSVIVYCGFLSVVWLLSMVVATTRLFHTFTIQVKPLQADGSGGLDVLNRFLWMGVTLMVIGVCAAITLGLASFSGDYGGIYSLVYILCFLITLPLLLSAWLVLPHQVMVRARNELLQPLVEEYERAVRETMPSVKGETTAIHEGTERLAALQKRYEQVRNNFPTWPIEVVQLRRLAIVLVLPFLLSLLPSLVEVFTRK
jgi:hypothetical protein